MLGLHFLLKLCITGCFCICCVAWRVQMPRHIVALKGSCLVIPCSFDYYQNPPVNPNRVVWYQYVKRGYPLVYDDWYPDSVIPIFKGKTHVLTDRRSCTLQIYPVTWSHHRQTLYPWVDPENVGSGTYAFYETTVTIEVVDRAKKPNLMVTGVMKVGQYVKVQCTVYHSCHHYPPSLSLNIPLKDHSLHQIRLTDGTSKTMLSTLMFVERDQQIVECVAKYKGGETEKTTQTLNAKCSFSPLSITSMTEEFLEGVPSKVTCTASYTCAQNNPTLTWNYGNMEASAHMSSSGKALWKTISTVKFISAAKDHGNDLTCYAVFTGGQRQEASISLRVKRNMMSLGWSFSAPSSISGIAGSCVVVPCTFTYSHSRPTDPKVIWYLYDSKGYSPVYSQNQGMVSKYSSRTSLIGSVKDGNCTLKIERLQMSHSQDRVYPWVDKNPITSYHTTGFSFYDKTTQIIVSDHAKEPELSLIGILRVGEQSRVSCSVQHSCISAPPSLAVSGVSGEDNTRHTMLSDGVWEQRVERVWTVSEEDQRVRCTVSYPGGQKATSETELNVECPRSPLSITSMTEEFLEGVPSKVTCTASYTCAQNKPTLTWNYGNMEASSHTSSSGKALWKTISTVNFISAAKDHGKSLTCYAVFTGGQRQEASISLRVKRNMMSLGWSFSAPSSISGMAGSCVVVPCTFTYSHSRPTDPKVIWYLYDSKGYSPVYSQNQGMVSKYSSRTSLIGSVKDGNCTLKIERLQMSHNQDRVYPWVDKNPITSYHTTGFSFYDKTTQIIVSDHAKEPELSLIGILRVGEQSRVSCSVQHSCISAPPSLAVSGVSGEDNTRHTMLSDGVWEQRVERVWTVSEEDQRVRCTVSYPGGQKATSETELNVECPRSPLSITSMTEEFLEGVPSKVTCTASYTCAQNKPTLTWNYGNMEASSHTSSSGKALWKTISTVNFISAAKDHGKSLTCYAVFTGGQRQEASISLRVKRNMMSLGWSFSAPSSISGMAGSCVVVPCTFTYSHSRPTDPKVIWYLYDSKGYSPVYSQNQGMVSKYSSRTSLIGSVKDGNCTLKIERLQMSHSQDRVYPWVDKNPITSYHTTGFSFYDQTTQIIVSDHAKEPELSLIGIPRVGEQSRVSCSVQHSCISAPPSLALSGVIGEDNTRHTMLSDGVWEQRVERVWTVSEDDQRVRCTVSYPGGQKATSETELNVDCPYDEITMIEKPENLTEGMAKYVVCSVDYKCKRNTPDIVWNFGNMQNKTDTKHISKNSYRTISNITFIGSLKDDRKALTCTAHFRGGETSDTEALHITRYKKPENSFEDDTFPASVPFRVQALSRSCVVIPCSYENPHKLLLTRGIWVKQSGSVVYHNGRSQITDHFKDRTRMVGNLHHGDCSLEIDDIKPFDNGPFCFKAEKGSTEYRFNNSCAFVLMNASPEKPVMTKTLPEATAGSIMTVSCSVTHTCPTRPPEFVWSIAPLTNDITHTAMKTGVWETTSNISFIVPNGDGQNSVTCTANFWRNKQESNTSHFIVKGSLIHQMRRSIPIIAPVTFFVLITIILAVVFGVIMCKNRRKLDDSLRPPPRPEKRRSLFERLNRTKEASGRPPRPEKRRSFWQRFSRRSDDRVVWQKRNSHDSAAADPATPKARCPSPQKGTHALKRDQLRHFPHCD
ncbi:uncharacterized protein LOC110171494 isoform X2 [Boleophthalmus pectinirostris]|uniref:uncharacterized protein LOC110171494 isoform X2 n=1 Tax=Boleophthalmus pectinirostris TaxID=150288 RepID=UPI00243280DE|nr:uncharacterized protein LOC110171494 isoform X2 [Boleophthalmus pectinirostris]